MWHTALAVTSFVLMPLAFIFLVYATFHSIFTLQWRLFVLAAIIFIVSTIAHTVIGIIAEG
ncbi:MAG TPA: hypothetical protein VHD38_03580 [Candidatus Paceibacterota bacterium]|jgi:hypothetical protein|nr:hypothetical protein [Candidatus Paceibacterota bacterium]